MKTHCKHGNKRSLGICPDCDSEKMYKKQRANDRRVFKARIDKILGKPVMILSMLLLCLTTTITLPDGRVMWCYQCCLGSMCQVTCGGY